MTDRIVANIITRYRKAVEQVQEQDEHGVHDQQGAVQQVKEQDDQGVHDQSQQGSIQRPSPMAQSQEQGAQQQTAVAPPGWEETVKHMKKHDEIDNPWALAWHMKNKGDTPHHASQPRVFLAAHARMMFEAAVKKIGKT